MSACDPAFDPPYDQEEEAELRHLLSAYLHGGENNNNAEGVETNQPGSPDPLFDSPGPSNIASAFAAVVSNPALARAFSVAPDPSGGLPENGVQADANFDSDGWTNTDSSASHTGSVGQNARFPASGVGASSGARLMVGGGPPAGFGRGRENGPPPETNASVPYTCWSCGSRLSLKRKESRVLCNTCGGRIVMKVRPNQTVTYSTM